MRSPSLASRRPSADGMTRSTSQLDIAVSTEDDVEVRRLEVTNHRRARGSWRSRAMPRSSWRPGPTIWPTRPSGSSSWRPSTWPTRRAALSIGARAPDDARPGRCTCSVRRAGQGPVEWETDRGRFLGRGRGPEDPQALDGRPLTGTTGVLLDPIVSLRQRILLAPGAVVRLTFTTGVASSRETALALAQRYRDPSAAGRTFAMAFAPPQSNRTTSASRARRRMLFERLASRVLYRDGSLRAGPGRPRPERAGPGGAVAARHLRRPSRSCWCAVARGTASASRGRFCRHRSTGASRD